MKYNVLVFELHSNAEMLSDSDHKHNLDFHVEANNLVDAEYNAKIIFGKNNHPERAVTRAKNQSVALYYRKS